MNKKTNNIFSNSSNFEPRTSNLGLKVFDPQSSTLVLGARGMVGSAIVRKLQKEGFSNLLTPRSSNLDLRSQIQVNEYFQTHRPEFVFLAAAKVGGIHANNTFRGQFLYENMMMEMNVMHAAYENGVKKLLFLGSSCIYPKLAPQPLKEEYLLTGELERTNSPYAIAKIAGIEMAKEYRHQYGCNFISCMPTNLYGPNDNYDLQNSHVLPALFRKFLEAKESGQKEVVMWGTGSPLREFLHVDDLAEACYFLMQNYNGSDHLNVGSGEEISIKDLAKLIAEIVGYKGEIIHDYTKPDGTPRKLMDSSKIHALGWKAKISLREGISALLREELEWKNN